MNEAATSRTVVIFTGRRPAASTIETIEALLDAFPAWQAHIFHERPPRHWGRYVRGKLQRLRREPVSYPAELVEQWVRRWREGARRAVPGGPRRIASYAELVSENVTYRACTSLTDPMVLDELRALRPWLGLALSAPRLKPTTFGLPALGTLNVHKSLLPDYRGMPPGFWEIHDGAAHTGVTVHWVDEGLDSGPIAAQRVVSIPPYATPAGLAARLDEVAVELLIDTLRQIDGGACPSLPQVATGRPPHRRPSWWVRRTVARRVRRKHRASGRIRELVKRAVLGTYVHAWAPLRNLARRATGRCHATVLLYHRVSDEWRDGLTVGVEQFRRQLDVLRRHYDVLDLPTLLATRGQPRRRPAVLITFDDGYADNYLAARLLRRAGVPATFFLSTRIVGTERAFAHDVRRGGAAIPALGWAQVAQMARWGFRFGNHTADHANLGALPLAEGIKQVRTARDDLAHHLRNGAVVGALAYPFGKPSDIRPEVRAALDALGIGACLSAHGGVNPPNFDPMNIVRQGIDHNFTMTAFRAAVEGWPLRSR